jgi:hypothetical protein
MENDLKIIVKEEHRDRYARLTQTKIGQKIVPTPSFCVQLQDPNELDLMLRIKEQAPYERLATNVVRFVDMQNALWRLHPNTPRDVFGVMRKDRYSLFFENQVLLLDKSLEYLYYQNRMHGFHGNPYTSRLIIDHINKIDTLKEEAKRSDNKRTAKSFESKKDTLHREFWRDLADEESKTSNRKRFDLINSFLKCDLDYNADVAIPAVPLVDDDEMLEIAKKMNSDAKELARGKKPCATYFLFKNSALSDRALLDKALEYIMENSRDTLTVIKFKYLDLTNKDRQTERDNYREFMSTLEFFGRSFKNRATIVLENNCQTFVSYAGFDIVSSSFTNYDIEHSFGKFAPYGKYLDAKLLILRSWKDMTTIYNTKKVLPHACYYCKNVSVDRLEDLKPDEWWVTRRGHTASFMDEWFGYVSKAIKKDKNVELIVDRLANSKVQILKDLLPRNW